MDKKIKIAIRELVEFIVRSGDIDSRYAPRDRMYEGARIHRVLQKKNMEKYDSYQSEVRLTAEFVCQNVTYILDGRADGVFLDGGKTVIDEIKTTSSPLDLIDESNLTHWAQAMCYACIYASQNGLDDISVRLTYADTGTYETKNFIRDYTLIGLQEFLDGLLDKYTIWANMAADWEALRNGTITKTPFPFPQYRKGQRELAVRVYKTIAGSGKLFVQAPTGTGKTISALFPAVKAMGEGKTSKIFYLTAKTITRQVAEEAFDNMRRSGLRLKTVTLTAKDKICFCDTRVCRPEVCQYAKGYFDKANDAVYDVVTNCDSITRAVIETYAERHTVCPFELSLDVSLWTDCIICDYNYVFDPRVYLRRFFAEGGSDCVFLIDEAHNLVDRSREMFSAQLCKSQFYEIKKQFKKSSKDLDRLLNAVNRHMLELRKQCDTRGFIVTPVRPEDFYGLVIEFTALCELLLKENGALGDNGDFLQLYFDALNFALIYDLYDERYVTFTEASHGDVTIRLFCLDPSFLLSEAFRRGGSAVLYSATLTPLPYFRDILGGSRDDELLALGSPFDTENL
ncbi:MAG: DEAD/DEAH box helicase, partial [Clostridiales bacterium]|nr:DEAD/DEAH box helicase [Clostridiales bacterium]